MDLRAIVFSLGLLVSAGPALGQCPPQWSDWFQGNGTDDQVTAMAVYDDDGPGPHPPELYIGGKFLHVNGAPYGGQEANWIAKWNGVNWSPVGSGIGHHLYPPNYYSGVKSMTVFDPIPGVTQPRLIVAGQFDHSDWPHSDRVQSWDGHQWTKLLGTPTQTLGNGEVHCLAVHDADGDGPNPPELYAGGSFDVNLVERWPSAGVARWDGTGWHGLNAGLWGSSDVGVRALASYDDDGPGPHLPKLIAGGLFYSPEIGGVCMASWDGQAWSAMPGLVGYTYTLIVFDEDGNGPRPPSLFAIGNFTDIAGTGPGWIARWNGTAWSTVGTPPNYQIDEGTPAVVFDPDGDGPEKPGLYLSIYNVGLAKWDGQTWSQVAPLATYFSYDTHAMVVFNDDGVGPDRPAIFMHEPAPSSDGYGAGRFSKWDGQNWSPLLTAGLDFISITSPQVTCMAVGPDYSRETEQAESLYVAGMFTACGDYPTTGLAKWDGRSWSPIDNDFGDWWSSGIGAMAFFASPSRSERKLHVAVTQYNVGNSEILIKRQELDGSWTQIGSLGGESPYITAMISVDDGSALDGLYPVGRFDSINDIPVSKIARWDGSSWHDVGGALEGDVYSAAVYDEDGNGPMPPKLFVSGEFKVNPSDQKWSHLASWDGSRFTAIECPLNDVEHLTVFDEDGSGPLGTVLVATGWSSDPTMNGIAKWDGTRWVGFNAFPEGYETILAVASFDEDGEGPLLPSLVIVGGFTQIAGVPADGIAEWRANQWTGFNSGLRGPWLSSLVVYNEDGPGRPPALYFGGSISSAGPYSATGIARWGRPVPFVLKHPQSRTAKIGDPTVFTVHASGAEPLTYQWRKDGHPLRDLPHVTGTTTDSLHLEKINHGSEGDYDVIITNPCGTTISKPAHLTAVPPGRPRP